MATSSLKEYLKRYETKNEEEEQKKKRKKKKKTKPESSGVLVVDEDPVWQKPVQVEDDDGNDSPDEMPVVDEDIEVKRMKKLEQIRLRRGYNTIAEDGSGWVSLSPKRANTVDPISDISPSRRQRTQNDTPSPEHELRHSKSEIEVKDLSAPRRSRDDLSPSCRRASRTDLPEPQVKASRDDTDLSPPRKRMVRNDTPSPEPLVNRADGTDLSPPRRRRVRNDIQSPKPLVNRADGTDLSPPRKRRARNDTPSPEPLVNRADADLSPPRKRRVRNDTPSPKRRVKLLREGTDNDMSPPRQRSRYQHTQSPEPDMLPPRQSRGQTSELVHDSDLSPPRKSKRESTGPASLKEKSKTGLISGSEIREEISKTKKDNWLRFKEMDPSVSGRGAEPVFRDKIKGERVSKEEYLKSKRKGGEDKPKEKELEWGKGLAQKREAEARLQELELEKNKPFARTRDDPELDNMLKDRLRWGDPMAQLVKKKQPEPVLKDLGDAEKMKESGFIVPQDIPPHSWIVRKLDAAPNRYGIRPGRHWDGVDRSNGFEKKMFTKLNEKQATEREAYLWSVSDM
ncbi:LOW QUALITY PROTEIN: BUD13 homolog [Hibiscus syriacus]|uniref:LOW QUALITY PROTEIN: BUD13 homolog n=1 Tax=Hibiscus syriacus TaxID=106335 RepID=UPI0019214668|nr:LOW QUALITY PROTEIN: BUD13 homolog [Hibiscus syriacus]